MWCRVVEFMLACWLALSPFIFRHDADATMLWVNDLTAAALVGTFSLMSYNPRTGWAHYLTLVVGAWLIAFAFLAASPPPPPAYQNHVVIGLLLLMFAILPNWSRRPPKAWIEYYGHDDTEPSGDAARRQ